MTPYERLTLVADLSSLPVVFVCYTFDEANARVCHAEIPFELRITPETLEKIQSGELSCLTI